MKQKPEVKVYATSIEVIPGEWRGEYKRDVKAVAKLRARVKKHGGRFEIVDEDDDGTRILIYSTKSFSAAKRAYSQYIYEF